MKPINFINTLSVQEHRALRTWWRFSLMIVCSVLLTMFIMQTKQLYTLYTASAEHRYVQAQLNVVQREHEPYSALKKEEDALRAQRAKIDRIYHTAERSGELLAALYATDQSVRVQSCKLNKTDFELIMQCPTAEVALQELKRVRTVKQFDAVKLSSLQRAHNSTAMIATMQGKIRKS